MTQQRKMEDFVLCGDVQINIRKYKERLKPMANGCIEYDGARHRQGYGMISGLLANGNKGMMTTHRVAMKMKLGRPLNKGECVINLCDNPACVNPDHLELGDLFTRAEKMKERNRFHSPVGKHIRDHVKQKRDYKYTEEEMLFIRGAKIPEIMTRFNKTKTQSYRLKASIKTNYRWLDEVEKGISEDTK